MKADWPATGSSNSIDSSALPNMSVKSCFAHTMQWTGLEGVLRRGKRIRYGRDMMLRYGD